MFEFFARLFRGEPSGAKAKERLRLVLLSDHLALAPDVVESLRTDLLEVISRYVEVDFEHVDVTFEQREHEVAMLANVPILSMKGPHERPRAPVAVAAAARNGAAPGLHPVANPPVDAEPAALEPSAGEPAAVELSAHEPAAASAHDAPPVDANVQSTAADVASIESAAADVASTEEPAPPSEQAPSVESGPPSPPASNVASGAAPPAVIALPMASAQNVGAKVPRSRRRRRRKAAVNGTQAQQSKTGAMSQPQL